MINLIVSQLRKSFPIFYTMKLNYITSTSISGMYLLMHQLHIVLITHNSCTGDYKSIQGVLFFLLLTSHCGGCGLWDAPGQSRRGPALVLNTTTQWSVWNHWPRPFHLIMTPFSSQLWLLSVFDIGDQSRLLFVEGSLLGGV